MLFCIYAGGLTCLVGETVVAMPKFLKLDVEIRWQKKLLHFAFLVKYLGHWLQKPISIFIKIEYLIMIKRHYAFILKRCC